MPNGVLGAWKLRSFHVENVDTKDRSEPFGPEPRGTLILHPDGWMAALLTPRNGAAPAAGADGAAALEKLVAYSGRYRLEPPDRLVTSVDVAWIEAWIGTDQVRTYVLDGNRLDLFTPPGRLLRPGGGTAIVVGTLSWTRQPSTPFEGPGRLPG